MEKRHFVMEKHHFVMEKHHFVMEKRRFYKSTRGFAVYLPPGQMIHTGVPAPDDIRSSRSST